MRTQHVVLIIGSLAWLSTTAGAAPLGTAFTYQGRLQENGSGVTDSCDFEFGLFDSAEGGIQVGSTHLATGVVVTDGRFTTEIDFGPGAFVGEARWLETTVACPSGAGSPVTLAPRQRIAPTPQTFFADRADTVDGLDASDLLDKATYDPGDDGTVDAASSVPWVGISGVPSGIADGDDDQQMLSLVNDQLSISGGNNIDLSGYAVWTMQNGYLHTDATIVGIGDTVPTAELHVKQTSDSGFHGLALEESGFGDDAWVVQNSASSRYLDFETVVSGSQSLISYITASTGAYNQVSARRLKEDIRPLEGVLDKVLRLRPVRYRYRDRGAETVGLIAEDVAPLFPEIVSERADEGLVGIAYSSVGLLAVRALQEQQAIIEQQQQDIDSLRAMVEDLIAELAARGVIDASTLWP